jgi:hypothetical protein
MPFHSHCRICRTELPEPFLDFGKTPLANAFLRSPGDFEREQFFPLAVAACSSCGLVQLDYVVPAEQLYRDYIYVSSTSEAVSAHAETLAQNLVEQYRWGPSSLLIEIASNDGTVLKAFSRRGVRVLGIEPATNVAAVAEADGVETVNEFFTKDVARAVAKEHGQVAGLMGRHVLAHIDDLHDCFEGVDALLSPDGVFVVEMPYLGDLLEHVEFDTIYHEHLSYFPLAPIKQIAAMHGLRLVDAERIGLHGGSVILHLRKGAAGAPTARLEHMFEEEQRKAFTSQSALREFARLAEAHKHRFEAFVDELSGSGARLIGYGAAAKANTMLNYCPVAAKALGVILDRSPHKHGWFTPGTHIPVQPPEAWREIGASHMLILAWNFQDEIVRQMRGFAEEGGQFVQVRPRPAVITPARS